MERRNYEAWSVSCLVYFWVTTANGLAGAATLRAWGNTALALLSGVQVAVLLLAVTLATFQRWTPAGVLAAAGACAAAAMCMAAKRQSGDADAGLPSRREPSDDSHGHGNGVAHAHAAPAGKDEHVGGDAPTSMAAAALRRYGAAAAIVCIAVVVPHLLRAYVRHIPAPLQVASFAREGDYERPHDTCGYPPMMNTLVPRVGRACPTNPPYYGFDVTEAGAAVLVSTCRSEHGGAGTYELAPISEETANTTKKSLERAFPRILRNVTPTPFPDDERVAVPLAVTTVRVTCRLSGGRVWDEFAMVVPNMKRRMDTLYAANMARLPSSAPPADPGQPSVMVILMDALSRHLSSAVLRETMRTFREQRLSSVTAFEFDHFSTAGHDSAPNYAALFCNAWPNTNESCAPPESNLFEHAARARMTTLMMNNFCIQRPEVKSHASNFTYDGFNSNGFVCLRGTGMTESCVHGQSVSRSFVHTARDLLLHAHGRRRPFMALVAPHEAHMIPHTKLLAVQPLVLDMLRALDGAGALRNAVVFYLADHGQHYDNRMTEYAPALYAHHNPTLFALVGNDLLAPGGRLPADAMRTLLLNRGRLLSMHDVYTAAGSLLGAPASAFKPGTVNFLRKEVPANRTCRQAWVRTLGQCNCFGPAGEPRVGQEQDAGWGY